MLRSTGLLARGQCAPTRWTHCNVGCYLLRSPWLKNVCGVAASDITSKPQNTQRLKAALMSERQNMQLFSPRAAHQNFPNNLVHPPVRMFQSVGKTNLGPTGIICQHSLRSFPFFTPLNSPFQNLAILRQPWRLALCMSCIQVFIPSIWVVTKTKKIWSVAQNNKES